MKLIDMTSLLKPELLLPILLLLVQAFILVYISMVVLKKLKVLKAPYGGMEYSQVILASSFIFSVMFISTASITGVFQSFKLFQNAGGSLVANIISKFSQFFLIIVFFELLFTLVFLLVSRFLIVGKKTYIEVEGGNVPVSILLAIVTLAFGIVLRYSAVEIIEYITPQYIYFR